MNEPTRDYCPGDPHGHVWQLQRDEAWFEEQAKREWTTTRIMGYTIGILIPIIGWVLVIADVLETQYRNVGRQRTWYCVKCRTFEKVKTTYKEETS